MVKKKVDLDHLKKGQWLGATEKNLARIINFAIKNNKAIKIKYKDRKLNRTTRTVYPLGIIVPENYKKSYSGRMLSSHCMLRNDYRYFRINRIESIQIGDEVPSEFTRKFNNLPITRINQIKQGDYNFDHSDNTYSPLKKTTQTRNTKISRPKKQESNSSSNWFWIIFWIVVIFFIINT